MSRCIVVLHIPRSGSSMIAGALHRMGCDMGEGCLQRPDELNSGGYYEDKRWKLWCEIMSGSRYSIHYEDTLPDVLEGALQKMITRCVRQPIWGFKNQRTAITFRWIWPRIAEQAEVRVVYTQRKWEEVVQSLVHHSKTAYGGDLEMDGEEAADLLTEWEDALMQNLKGFDGPIHVVNYNSVLENPQYELTTLERFAFGNIQSNGIDEALDWIKPGMKHCEGEI